MCAKQNRDEEEIYYEAISLPAHEQRAFLEEACQGNAELLERIELLLQAREGTDAFLNTPAMGGRSWPQNPHCLRGRVQP